MNYEVGFECLPYCSDPWQYLPGTMYVIRVGTCLLQWGASHSGRNWRGSVTHIWCINIFFNYFKMFINVPWDTLAAARLLYARAGECAAWKNKFFPLIQPSKEATCYSSLWAIALAFAWYLYQVRMLDPFASGAVKGQKPGFHSAACAGGSLNAAWVTYHILKWSHDCWNTTYVI